MEWLSSYKMLKLEDMQWQQQPQEVEQWDKVSLIRCDTAKKSTEQSLCIFRLLEFVLSGL